MTYFMLANGFEEAEALVPFDILTRCEINCCLVSFEESNLVTGSHGIRVLADMMLKDMDLSDAECIVFPGGGVGTENLDKNPYTDIILKEATERNLLIGAICAAPVVLAKEGLLQEKRATCYPDKAEELGDSYVDEDVVVDLPFVTGKSAGVAQQFALQLIEELRGKEAADEVAAKVYFQR